tara:strand:- start:53723 stop:54697 length:975 start_codon:yes stop_codon:yes gene_type:complete
MESIENMFEQIKDGFTKPVAGGGGQFKDILRFEKNNDYTVRLLPYVKNPNESIFAFQYHGWKSVSTGNYFEVIDPSSLDLPNPIKKYSYDLGDKLKALKLDKEDARMVRARNIWTKRAWLVNCLVINDPVNPDNNGTVKILRLGNFLHDDVIDDAFLGDRKDEFGIRIFDLSAKGCNLKIRCTDNGSGKYKDYKKSYFMSPSEIEGVSGVKDTIADIYDRCIDLTTIYPVKDYEEMKEILNTHFIGSEGETDNEEVNEMPSSEGPDLSSIIDEEVAEKPAKAAPAKAKAKATPAKSKAKAKDTDASDEAEGIDIDNILEGLDDL